MLQVEQLEGRVVPSTVVLNPSKDNTLYQSVAGDISNGAGPSFFAGETGGMGGDALRRGVIAFDIAGNIPAGATINSVTLSLHVFRQSMGGGAQPVELHRLSADWGEGTSDAGSAMGGRGAPATPNDATWVYRFYNTTSWANVGGDFLPTVSASASVGGVGTYSWGSTAGLVADVQSWLDNGQNFGWIVLGNETAPNTGKEFDSKESATPANRPTLTIDYTSTTAASRLVLSGFPSPVTAGVAGTETVRAVDAAGNTDLGYRGTVHFTSSDPMAVLPPDYMFTAADAGVHTFDVTLTTAGANRSITATDAASGFTGSQIGITVTPAAAASFVLSGFPSTAGSGLPGNVTVTAKDAFGNTTTGYTGTVHITTSDSEAVLPADHTFTAAENGVHVFSVTLNTAGVQSITATDTVNSAITGSQNGITVTAATVLDPNLGVRIVASGLGNPTNMTFLGDNDFLVLDKTSGRINHVINGVVAQTKFDMGAGPIPNLPVNFNSERGLLGITLSPNFATDHNVYLYWTENNSGPAPDGNVANTPLLGNRVDMFTWNSNTSTFMFDKNIIRLHSFQNDGNGGVPTQMAGNHNGGVVQFGPDGKLYIVIGDNGRRGWMQNLIDGSQGPGQTDENNGNPLTYRGGPAPDDAHLTGVLLRLNPDGSIPSDNPFVDIRDVMQAQPPAVASPLTGLSPLTGANERPNPTLSLGTGSFTAFLNQAMDTLTVIVSFQGLSGGTLAGGADISIGGPTTTGPAVLTLDEFPAGLASGQVKTTLTAANFRPDPAHGINTFADAAQAMLNGNAYFNLHTTQNPGGEIRGQIGPISTNLGNEADITNNLHKIYAYGIRNTFGYGWDPVTGQLWLEENGDQSFDKISIVTPGSNNGWVQSSGPLFNVDGSIDEAAIAEFKSIELRLSPNGPQQTRWSSQRIPDTAEQALSRLVMLPGAHYNPAVFSVRAEDPPAGLNFLSSSALGPQYQNALFEGEARDFLTAPGPLGEEFDGALFVFHPNMDRTGLDFGGDPNIRTSDNVFQNFRDFDLNGDTSFLFGTGFGIVTGIVTAPNGNLYVVSETKGAVYEIFRKDAVAAFHQTNLVSDIANPPGGAPQVVDANLQNPWGIALSPTSPFWVANQRTGVATLYSGDVTQPDGTVSQIAKVPLTVGGPTRMVVGSRATNSILRYDQATGAFIDVFVTPGSGGLSGPGGVAFGPDGNLYVSSNMNNSILRYDGRTGQFIDAFVPSGFAGLNKPSALRFGPDGNLYVNSHGPASIPDSSAILRFNGVTGAPLPAPGQSGAIFVPAGSGGLDQASVGLVFDRDGNLYVNSHRTDSVLRFDGVTGEPRPAPGQSDADFVPAGSGGLMQPSGLVFGPDGNLYVSAHDPSAQHGAVLRYDPTTGAPLPAPEQDGAFFVPIDSGTIRNPTALTFGSDGNLYVDSRGNSRVLRFDGQTGAPLPAAGQTDAIFVPQGSGGLSAPNSLNFFGSGQGSPTGQVFNGTTDFVISAGGHSGPALFITAGLDGAIAGWNPNVPGPGSTQFIIAATVPGAVYTGLAIGANSSGNFLYAANNNTGRIDVFDRNFQLTTLGPGGTFEDPSMPPGSPFRVFNIQNLGGTLYVTYNQISTIINPNGTLGTDKEHGGIVDAFDTSGHFLRRVVSNGVNAPWGLTLAPSNFGPFSNALLVGNFGLGDGKINAYDPNTGAFLGNITDATGKPIAIEGLWAITFGNGGSGGDTNALYFAAGINRAGANSFGAADGLFGSIRFAPPAASSPPDAAPQATPGGDPTSTPPSQPMAVTASASAPGTPGQARGAAVLGSLLDHSLISLLAGQTAATQIPLLNREQLDQVIDSFSSNGDSFSLPSARHSSHNSLFGDDLDLDLVWGDYPL
jgi:uncharacterized protein (TIGR03118 family)